MVTAIEEINQHLNNCPHRHVRICPEKFKKDIGSPSIPNLKICQTYAQYIRGWVRYIKYKFLYTYWVKECRNTKYFLRKNRVKFF